MSRPVFADRSTIEDLAEVLQDGIDGYREAAEKLKDGSRPDLVSNMMHYADRRAALKDELERFAEERDLQHPDGDDIGDTSGSTRAAAHRAWMSLKDALSGSDPDGVLDAAVQGEEYAVSTYVEALDRDLSPELRKVLERQLDQVNTGRIEMKILRRPDRY